MSKFKVKIVWGSVTRSAELSRSSFSFNELRDEVRVKYEVREFQLRYGSPSLGEVYIQDDATFHKVVKDAESRGNYAVEVRIISQERSAPTGKSGATSGGYTQPRAAPTSSPAVTSPKNFAPPPTAAVKSVANSNTIANFTVPGDRNSPHDKLSVKANQEDDHFAFVPQPAKNASEVSVTLEGTKLTFESITNASDGRSYKFTQAFNLPFTPNDAKTTVDGHTLKLYFA